LKIQYFSDIHLEFGNVPLTHTDADVIVAAGDIGVGTQGVHWLLQAGKPVIYVAGNHEYYGGDLYDTFARIVAMAEGTCVHFLENQSIVINGVRFLGTTLWTDYEGGDPDKMALAEEKMNDYTQISNQARGLRPADLLEVNWQARHWLEQELSRPFQGKTVVVTHHAPSFTSWNNGKSASYRGAYCSDMSALTRAHRIDLWLHGHVHSSADYYDNGVRVACNPRGYSGYQVVKDFDLRKTIEI
jgi:Icc-related predicted phosphoesterase